MDEDTLRAFASVCRTGNISRSAIELHRSQSALSRRIATLEHEVGARLLDRVPSGVQPTPHGDALLAHVDAALAALADGRRAVTDLVTSDVGPISIVIVGSLASGWITDALRGFATSHPQASIRLQTANSNDVVDLVRRGDADIGIGYGYGTEPGLSSELLFDEELEVACAPDHPHAGSDVGTLAALRDERWFAFSRRLPRAETNARFILGILASAGVPAENIQSVDSLTAQHRLIEAGFGIGLLATSNIAAQLTARSLAVIMAGTPPTTRVFMTTRANRTLTHAAQSLIALLGESATNHRPTAPTRRSLSPNTG